MWVWFLVWSPAGHSALNGRDHLHLMPGPANLILMVTGHGAQSLDKLPTHRRSPPILLPGQSSSFIFAIQIQNLHCHDWHHSSVSSMTGVVASWSKPFSVKSSLCGERRLLHPPAPRPRLSALANSWVRVSFRLLGPMFSFATVSVSQCYVRSCESCGNKISSFSAPFHLRVPK